MGNSAVNRKLETAAPAVNAKENNEDQRFKKMMKNLNLTDF